jgi:hypothetical protein
MQSFRTRVVWHPLARHLKIQWCRYNLHKQFICSEILEISQVLLSWLKFKIKKSTTLTNLVDHLEDLHYVCLLKSLYILSYTGLRMICCPFQFACCHGCRERIFLVFYKLPGSWKSAKWLFIISMKFPIDIPSCLTFEFWDFGRIMALCHWVKSQNRDSRIFSSSPWNFWSIEHNHALYRKFGTLVGLRSRPQAQMTMSSIQKHSWYWDLSNEHSYVPFW